MNPRIVLFDIETSPNLAYVWGKWEQDVIEFEREWDLLCWTVKELGGKSRTLALCDVKNEEVLVKELWKELDSADIIIAHNGDGFDLPKSNTKFLEYRLPPPSPYKTVDTLKVARSRFAFNSNKLDDLAKFLGLERKLENGGFKTWMGCLKGDKKAWGLMKKYNAKDCTVLEQIYHLMKPWMNNHPDLSVMTQELVCPSCGSDKVIKRAKRDIFYKKKARMSCNDCGRWFRI